MNYPLGIKSAGQPKVLTSVATTYAENTNRMSFTSKIRRARLQLVGSNYVYMIASATALADPATSLADATLRQRFVAKALADGGSEYELNFNFEVQYLYFLADTASANAHVVGYAL